MADSDETRQDENFFSLDGEQEDFSFDPTSEDLFEVSTVGFRDQPGIQYPALLLSNVLFMDCLLVLQSLKRDSYRGVDVWVELQGGTEFKHIGDIQLDSTVLIALGYLHVGVTVYYSHDELEVLDLGNPEIIERFI